MMSKKTKRLYGRMQHGIEQKKAAVSALETKRVAAENAAVKKQKKSAAAADSGKRSTRSK